MADDRRRMSEPHLPIQRWPHIGIEREPYLEVERRRRRGHGVALPQRIRESHGEAIRRDLTTAVASVKAVREHLGIAPDRLMVMEFRSWDPGCRDVFENRFGAAVVDERLVTDEDGKTLTYVLTQFAKQISISRIAAELDLYHRSSTETTDLPPGLRQAFFDGLETIRAVSREERIGSRLREEGFPNEQAFPIDVDLWHPGTESEAMIMRTNLRRLCNDHGGEVVEDLHTSSLVLARVLAGRGLANILLDLDIVAQVNLPPVLPTVYGSLFRPLDPLPDYAQPTGHEPMVAVLDSGVVSGHPLLRGWIVEEEDFDTGEGTVVDQQGHGTQVAGLAVYGSVARCIERGAWVPEVLIANAKILRRDPQDPNSTTFPTNRRPEALVARAIRHFHRTRGCRVFNLSIGNSHDVYTGGRQFAWAEILDQLARELDIVIVVSAGNHPNPTMPTNAMTRDEFQVGVRDTVLSNSLARLCNPATSAIAVTVGSIARSDRPRTMDSFAGAPKGAPAPFSRVGPGYEIKPTQRAVKPDFVAYGGSFAVRKLAGGQPHWVASDAYLGEPTIRLNTGGNRLLTAASGTSFAAPQVSHAAACALDSVSRAVGATNANAARAILGVSAEIPPCGHVWLKDANKTETWEKLRLAGYGMVNIDRVRASLANDVCLIASDSVEEDHWHVYEMRVPPVFLSTRGEHGISVSLAFDPPVRSSRRAYLARTMWLEVLKGLTLADVNKYRARYTGPGKPPSLKSSKLLDMRPAKTELLWSTLQVRKKVWTRSIQLPVVGGAAEPMLHVLVGCQRRFPHGEETNQRYSVAVRFWHTDTQIDLYQEVRARIRPRVVVPTRVETST